ncbi:unnamed protein product [Lactuca virosa]|uniref:DUF4283 domain-containing protein n=1 Tax=Lactuca virosa TaxID=75947 RepID=A0AAU9NCQ0_9ASTR|nr:unnamed protein product [Lactuca virosa]
MSPPTTRLPPPPPDCHQRVIWLELLGFPCCPWNDAAVSKIAKTWGDVCFLEEDDEAPLDIQRVCIKTVKPSLIREKIKFVAHGIEYAVVARELSNSEPDILEKGANLGQEIQSFSGDSEDDDYFDNAYNEEPNKIELGREEEEIYDSSEMVSMI